MLDVHHLNVHECNFLPTHSTSHSVECKNDRESHKFRTPHTITYFRIFMTGNIGWFVGLFSWLRSSSLSSRPSKSLRSPRRRVAHSFRITELFVNLIFHIFLSKKTPWTCLIALCPRITYFFYWLYTVKSLVPHPFSNFQIFENSVDIFLFESFWKLKTHSIDCGSGDFKSSIIVIFPDHHSKSAINFFRRILTNLLQIIVNKGEVSEICASCEKQRRSKNIRSI